MSLQIRKNEMQSQSMLSQPSMTSLRLAQQAMVFKMLNLNQDVEEDENKETVWKVLIYDKMGQDIISPLIKVGDLRERGVTVHM